MAAALAHAESAVTVVLAAGVDLALTAQYFTVQAFAPEVADYLIKSKGWLRMV